MNDKVGEARARYLAARFEFERFECRMKRHLQHLRYQRDSAEKELVEAMLECDPPLKNFADANDLGFKIVPKFGISVTQKNTDAIREWLLEREGDDTPFIEEKVSKSELSRLVKKIVEDEGTDVVPDFLNLYRDQGISVTGWDNYVAHKEAMR